MDYDDPVSAFSDDDEEVEAEAALEEWIDEIETLLGGAPRKKEPKKEPKKELKKEQVRERVPVQDDTKRQSWLRQLVGGRDPSPAKPAAPAVPHPVPLSPPPPRLSAPVRRTPPAALLALQAEIRAEAPQPPQPPLPPLPPLPPRCPPPCIPLPNRPIPLDVPTDCDSASLYTPQLSGGGWHHTSSLMLPPTFIPAREYYGAPCAQK